MPVDEDDFKRVIGNMLRMPPRRHEDSKLGTRKTTGKLIPSEEFTRFDKAMDKIMSVSKEELDRRLVDTKANKTGKRYTK